ncbi:hypothetical protein D1AOALGA4SA_12284 [Olavius algarvensis Delta 1 endosymbiont]|nr:hypothetical protein D1AOALGA4SA_12284 [Olavius algarvensis Delta 1 endosymbiont]
MGLESLSVNKQFSPPQVLATMEVRLVGDSRNNSQFREKSGAHLSC